MKPKCCPTCQRPFAPEVDVGGPKRQKIYDYIAKHPEGVTREQVMTAVYADDPDGGPEHFATISGHVLNINKFFRAKHLPYKINGRRGPGSIFLLKPRVLDKVEMNEIAAETDAIYADAQKTWAMHMRERAVRLGAKKRAAASDPRSMHIVARALGVSRQTVLRWRREFRAQTA